MGELYQEHEYTVSTNEHVDFLTQIARGMAHLHSLDPPIVHGDLAARNVLIRHHPKDETRCAGGFYFYHVILVYFTVVEW